MKAYTLYSDYQKGSYNSVNFLVPSESVERGKKTIKHEYPGSDKRFIEEQGKIPPIFSLDITIHGQDAINKRIRLETELEKDGPGTLVHPVYGVLTVNTIGPFKVSSDQTSKGEFKFEVTFGVTSTKAITPSVSNVDNAQISKDAGDAKEALDASLEDAYKEPSFADSLNSTADKITDITAAMSDKINKMIEPLQDGVAAFNGVVDAVTAGVFTIVSKASTVKETFTELYNSYLDIVNLPQDLIGAWNDLIDFGLDDGDYKSDTGKRFETANNSKILNEHTQVTALLYTYEASVYQDYDTEQDLDDQVSYLEEKFDLLMRDSFDDQSTTRLVENQDVYNALYTLRTNAKAVLDQKAQNLWKVVDLDAGKSSMALTAFRFYNSLDNLDALSLLNTSVNHASFTQEIKALTK